MYRIVVMSRNKVVTLTNRSRRNAFARWGGWLGVAPDAYLQQAVEVVADDGTTYILDWRTIPRVGGY